MDLGYKKIDFIESHMRQDFENYIYPIYFSITDLKLDIINYTFQKSKGAEGVKTELSQDKVELLLDNQTLENGFMLSIFNNKTLIIKYNDMILMTENLISSINQELEINK
jgi:hypothetical protein